MLRQLVVLGRTPMGVSVRKKLADLFKDESGEVNIVAIVILIGIAVVLALFFKEQIQALLERLFTTIGNKADDAVGGGGGE